MHFKKVFVLIISFLMLTSIFSTASYSLGISAGVSTWYTWWEMDQGDGDGTTDMGDTLMYGPMLSLRFSPQWSLSSAFLYGKFETPDGDNGEEDTIKRYDSDTTLNYSINRYFRVFAGFKFMGYTFDGGSNTGYGPGIGVGVVIPLTEQFMMMGSISGLYQWGTEKDDNEGFSDDTNSIGFNSSITLGYYIPAASVIITAGFRYQYFEMEVDATEDNTTREMDFTFYGFTFSAAYNFEI